MLQIKKMCLLRCPLVIVMYPKFITVSDPTQSKERVEDPLLRRECQR